VAHRFFNLAAAVSMLALCFIIIAWCIAGAINPRKQFVSLWSGCYLSIDARGADARLEVFNDAGYGPYQGSIISVARAGDPTGPDVCGFGDCAGIYYRLIRWPSGASLWTVSLSLGYLLLAAALLPGVWLVRQPLLHDARRRLHLRRDRSRAT
jgi:hypothetical protein